MKQQNRTLCCHVIFVLIQSGSDGGILGRNRCKSQLSFIFLEFFFLFLKKNGCDTLDPIPTRALKDGTFSRRRVALKLTITARSPAPLLLLGSETLRFELDPPAGRKSEEHWSQTNPKPASFGFNLLIHVFMGAVLVRGAAVQPLYNTSTTSCINLHP